MTLIKIKALKHTYQKGTLLEQKALKNVNLEIKKGDFLALVGQSGSGKSTLIQHLNGLLKATSGSVEVKGYEIKNTKKAQKKLLAIRKSVSIAFQFPEIQLFSETIEKEIMFGPLCFGVDKISAKKLAKKYIKIVGLDESFLQKSPFELSGGQKRRVALASIMSIQPEILIVDEPTAGLDPIGKVEIMDFIKELNNSGLTVILITHNMNDVWKYAKKVIVLSAGNVVFQGSTFELFKNTRFLRKHSIAQPNILELADKLMMKGYNIPYGLKNQSQLVEAIAKLKKG